MVVDVTAGACGPSVVLGADGANGVCAKALGLGADRAFAIAYEGNLAVDRESAGGLAAA